MAGHLALPSSSTRLAGVYLKRSKTVWAFIVLYNTGFKWGILLLPHCLFSLHYSPSNIAVNRYRLSLSRSSQSVAIISFTIGESKNGWGMESKNCDTALPTMDLFPMGVTGSRTQLSRLNISPRSRGDSRLNTEGLFVSLMVWKGFSEAKSRCGS